MCAGCLPNPRSWHNTVSEAHSVHSKCACRRFKPAFLRPNGVDVVQDGGRRGSRFWVSPELDMFATQMNNQLPVFVSPMPNPLALEYDALSVVWTRRDWIFTLSLLQSSAGF